MLVGIFSPKGTYDTTFLGNYAYINLNDPIARLYGVGQTQVFGAGQYAMRLWVQPDKLAKLALRSRISSMQSNSRTQSILLVRWWGTSSSETAIHLFRACARPPDVPGTIRRRDRARGARCGIVRVKDVARVN